MESTLEDVVKPGLEDSIVIGTFVNGILFPVHIPIEYNINKTITDIY